MSDKSLPVVGIICDREIIGPHPFHIAGDKYIQAIVKGSNCLPLLIPALGSSLALEQLVSSVDGILFTGGYSMVDPNYYQDEGAEPGTKLDLHRDSTSLPLIKKAVDLGVPIMGICRGFQEMNVAFGGSLHQKLHQVSGLIEHRENNDLPLEQQYAAAHPISVKENGKLAQIVNDLSFNVNSLHTQGVNQLGKGLTSEATAEDGLIEAFSVDNAKSFALALQWHPEWKFQQNPQSTKLFQAFGEACSLRKQDRNTHE
ncbi:gamma-glutamyl-gamma-aminobutyrate hydrolase family protein [Thalassomonas sp. M1454]|uniref:gamma-glutamyl-gamma-aminobutyrate hydrolase family protein n=1 Tax=Thalassomonas sp. M1454 TaxID=2594477 RepID=UPI001180EF6E|nr:gamma-glutamyl-gamma-aminobutyrate hydrolase family protein [Thalassomonas sp. M1454]TRX57827.1 gamma-glutamyl-gamma-aminobutyrate hydrolase family protein [Thalassomonas sp. M1454]